MADKLTLTTDGTGRGAFARTLLDRVVDALPDGVLVMDSEWRIVYANDMARRISRVEPEYIGKGTHWEHYPETVGTSIEAAYREAMATGVERVLEPYYFARFTIWYSIRLIPIEGYLILHYRDVTAEQEAGAERRELAEQLQQVLDATTDGVTSFDRDWRITYMNDRSKAILAPSGNVIGRNVWECFPAALYEGSPYVEHYCRAMDEGIAGSFEAYYPEPLNAWLHISVRPSRDGMIAFFRDVTAQKLKEDELRESEERYRILTELNPQSLWTADPEGRVLYANHRFLEYIGHDFVPRDGDEYLRCFDPADRERVVQAWLHSIATGEDYDIDARMLRASDGVSRWWHLRALPIRDENGTIVQWLGVASDVHENREAQERLQEQFLEIDRQRREVETIYLGSPIGMALYDAKDLRLLRINARQAEIFRLPAADAIGKTYHELAGGVPLALELIERAAAGEAVLNHQLEGTLDRRPDEYRYWNINYSPIFAEDGSVRAIASATYELTHQKRAEAALIQSEKLAAVGRLASSIAHEINNPLESVMNLIYIARQHAIAPEVQTFLDLADQELRRVSVIANQTLRFHKQASRPQAITCTELFSTVLSIYEGRLKNSNISIEKRKRSERPILCFEGEIRQVLNNLVSNAIDAMNKGGRLLLRSREATDWRSGVRGLVLTVADTGAGMDAETQAKIFEAFFTTKGLQGTGLGLWISAEIIERHHGRMRVRSSQGERHGTVFTLFLPFESVPVADPMVG